LNSLDAKGTLSALYDLIETPHEVAKFLKDFLATLLYSNDDCWKKF